MKLSILILSTPDRAAYLSNIVAILSKQDRKDVEIMINTDDGTKTIGAKRNESLLKANGEYVCFVDSDDEVSDNYIQLIMTALKSNPTHCSLKGVYTVDDGGACAFEHSNDYIRYRTVVDEKGEPVFYERYPNHLNVIRKDLALKAIFPEINHGEDTDWATQLKVIGDLTNEAYIKEVLYHYKFRTNK